MRSRRKKALDLESKYLLPKAFAAFTAGNDSITEVRFMQSDGIAYVTRMDPLNSEK
jgi:hypothetical protein